MLLFVNLRSQSNIPYVRLVVQSVFNDVHEKLLR